MALLITDTLFETTRPLYESNEEGKKDLFIEGIFMQSVIKNRNGRSYPEDILDREANRYLREYVVTKRSLGELNHPNTPQVNPERASHFIVGLKKEGTNWLGKAKILNTPQGNIVRGIIEGGAQLGVSSRGLGTLKEGNGIKIVQPDFFLSTIDIVSDPSAHEAWVNGIYEGQEWACPSEMQQTMLKKEIDEVVRQGKFTEEFLLTKFQTFLSSL